MGREYQNWSVLLNHIPAKLTQVDMFTLCLLDGSFVELGYIKSSDLAEAHINCHILISIFSDSRK